MSFDFYNNQANAYLYNSIYYSLLTVMPVSYEYYFGFYKSVYSISIHIPCNTIFTLLYFIIFATSHLSLYEFGFFFFAIVSVLNHQDYIISYRIIILYITDTFVKYPTRVLRQKTMWNKFERVFVTRKKRERKKTNRISIYLLIILAWQIRTDVCRVLSGTYSVSF